MNYTIFDDIRDKESSVWLNLLWERHNEKSALDPNVYDWYIDNNINIIQTYRPLLLLNYL